jgi:predicted nucleic acid-binding protein
MTTAIDTNILVALWDKDATLSSLAESALDSALRRGELAVAAPVFAELLAFPGRDERFLDAFFRDTSITVDWNLHEGVWRVAGRAFQAYSVRRKARRDPGPRRILADFVIGAHAFYNGFQLLTLDARLYGAAFPQLSLVAI